MAPTLAPELKMPVARERSRWGNHSAMVLMAAGEVSGFAEAEEEAGNAEAERGAGEGVGHGGEAPGAHDEGVAEAGA